MNPYLFEMELRERQREMVEEARRRRLINLFEAQNSKKQSNRILLAVADRLIALGEGLKHRYGHQPALSTASCRKN